MLDAYKELTPVIYGENGIRLLKNVTGPGAMCFSAHWHDRIELLHVIAGSMEAYLDNEHVTATTGQTVIIMPHATHCAFAGNQGVRYNMIAFDVEMFCNATIASEKYLAPIFKYGINFCPVSGDPAVAKAMDELEALLAAGNSCHPLCAIGKIYEIIGLFYQHCTADSRQIHKPDERFGKVLEYINLHYAENISAKDISEKFGYDETYFCRRFKEATGITTMKYIRVLRLELAQKLLSGSKEEIQNIAWQCGFSDISYFSNCFKQQFGVTPTEFRRQTTKSLH
ncbi:MAG: helix-turn-helix transcriptional regulator [Roseburia sp.]|nr:helix-turn-helix transcriptional regulator [Roseburia sp.]